MGTSYECLSASMPMVEGIRRNHLFCGFCIDFYLLFTTFFVVLCANSHQKMSSWDSLDQFFSFWSHFSRIDPSISEPLIISWHNFF